MNIQEMFDIKGKVALVTGGGRGIGKAIAHVYGEAGAKVVISGRRAEWINPTVEEFKAKGFDCTGVLADVAKPAEVERTVKAALDAHGQIDILVNNAGQSWGQPAEEVALAKWQQIIDVNLTGIFMLSQLVGQNMIERGQGGTIINIASIAGLRANSSGMPKTIAYNTSKAAVIGFTRELAKEWGDKGIRVNAIAPGLFPTRMASVLVEISKGSFEKSIALGRVGDVEELKGIALLLASPASSYITGQTFVVDGGASL